MVIPIETVYRGYRFRSRLEARWAVFFDARGTKWEYEAQGFELGNGERYLPDFFLPELGGDGLYAEVKAVHRNEDWRKAIRFANAIEAPVLLLDGPPDLRTYRVIMERCADADTRFTARFDDTYGLDLRLADDIEYLHPSDCDASVIKAIHAARAARFEFGGPLSRVI